MPQPKSSKRYQHGILTSRCVPELHFLGRHILNRTISDHEFEPRDLCRESLTFVSAPFLMQMEVSRPSWRRARAIQTQPAPRSWWSNRSPYFSGHVRPNAPKKRCMLKFKRRRRDWKYTASKGLSIPRSTLSWFFKIPSSIEILPAMFHEHRDTCKSNAICWSLRNGLTESRYREVLDILGCWVAWWCGRTSLHSPNCGWHSSGC